MAWKNIGRLRLRQTWLARRVIIQTLQQDTFYTHIYRWRDATFDDLQEAAFGPVENRTVNVPSLRLVK